MDDIKFKLEDLRNYAFNINAISDITFFIDNFNEINNIDLAYEDKVFLGELLTFMIEQVTLSNNPENSSKIEIIKEIIKNYIFNNLEIPFYHYYLLIRENSLYGRNNFSAIISNMIDEHFSFTNDFQKVCFVNFLILLKSRPEAKAEDNDLIDILINKINNIEIDKDNYPIFSPSKIKVLEEENRALQEELAKVNYVLMMGGLI